MNKICVIGLGRFGMVLALRLAEDGKEVLAIDNDAGHIDSIKNKVALAVMADATDPETLRELGVADMDLVVVSIGENFEAAQLAVMAAHDLGVPAVYARANDQTKRKIMKALKADVIIMPEEDAAVRLAQRLNLPGMTESVELDRHHSMVQVSAPPKTVGQTMMELKIRERYNLNLVAIKSRPTATLIMSKKEMEAEERESGSEAIISIPTGSTRVHSGDTLILVGKDSDIDRFLRENE